MAEEPLHIHQQAGVEDVQSSAGVPVLYDYSTVALHLLLHDINVPRLTDTFAGSHS